MRLRKAGARSEHATDCTIDFATAFCHSSAVGITTRQFETMQRRVAGQGRRPEPTLLGAREPQDSSGRIILGIDPSLRGTGYGVIQVVRPAAVALGQGTIRCPAGWLRSRCLAQIATTLRGVILQYQPTACVVEGLFYAQNFQTALIMGEARGVALVVAAEAGLEICEIAPRKVKQAMVGYGAAGKFAVARMVQRLLNLADPPDSDAADALALALTHAREQGRSALSQVKRI